MGDLLAAVKACDVEQTSALLSLGQKPSEMVQALIAAAEQNAQLVNMLLDAGADVNAVDKGGNYPLRAAVLSGDHHSILALLHKGADPNKETPRGTPLLVACKSEGMLETASLLLDHGAQVDYETKDGFTALTAAVRENKRELCQLLLKRGADPNRRGMDGSASAVDIAQAKVLPDVYSLLMQSCINSSTEQALADSERRQQQARLESEKVMAAEQEKLEKSAEDNKSEVLSRIQALRSENEELLAKYNFKRR